MKDSKERLFEIMSKIDPDFNLNEAVIPEDPNTDVEMTNNLKSNGLKKAYTRIDNQKEFIQAFDQWFGGLGVADKYKNKINITYTLTQIRSVLEKYGVKN